MAPATASVIGDDDEEDDWDKKMWDIDRRFAFEEAPQLQAAGKPPMAEPIHPGSYMPSQGSAKPPSVDPAQIIQERLEKRLLGRFSKD